MELPLPFSDTFDFFRGGEEAAAPLSEAPVCSDVPSDLERREERRSRFTRVVGGVVVALGLVTLLALSQHATPIAAAAPASPIVPAPSTPLSAETPVIVAEQVVSIAAPPEVAPAHSAQLSPRRPALVRHRSTPNKIAARPPL
ncbi:MAG TPA: hypothetical protein VEQ58_06440, partial [Polyangiaceae bacterium]|nr:hypothetical protein [Polyangiaceae bacterium]